MTYSESMVQNVSTIVNDAPIIQDEAKSKISTLDTAKIPFQRAATNLDRNLHDQITSVNDTLYATRDAYDERIDGQGCRTDLFWRLTGITSTQSGAGRGPDMYTFTCAKLGATYPKTGMVGVNSSTAGAASTAGLSTNTVTYFDGTLYNNFNLEPDGDGGVLNGVGSGLDAYYQPDNLHGLKLYDEPYAKDTLDTFRGVGVGTIGIGTLSSTNPMTILKPATDIDIKVGQLMTPSVSGYFASESVTVVGVGTTAKDLSPYPFIGITTTKLQVVPYITVDQLPVQAITAPLTTGEYVDMLFSQDPNTISDSLAVRQTDNPYVDQSIEIMSYNRAGAGVSIKYDNSGISSGTRSWNKFLDGMPDPDSEDSEDDSTISEPAIGADKIYYRIGFTDKPILYPSSGDASEGDTISVSYDVLPVANLYQSLPSCDNTALNASISTRDAAESALSGDNDFSKKMETTNAIKKKMHDEFSLRIWAYRMQIGTSEDALSDFNSFDALVTDSDYADIMNEGSLEDFA